MMGLVVTVHVIVCIGLIVIVLIQRGRGAGLVESFSGIESMFGVKTSAFLTKITTVFSIIFFVTCLSLTFFSLRQSKSLMRGYKSTVPVKQTTIPVKPPLPEGSQPITKKESGVSQPVTPEAQKQAEEQPVKFKKETPAAPLRIINEKNKVPAQQVVPLSQTPAGSGQEQKTAK